MLEFERSIGQIIEGSVDALELGFPEIENGFRNVLLVYHCDEHGLFGDIPWFIEEKGDSRVPGNIRVLHHLHVFVFGEYIVDHEPFRIEGDREDHPRDALETAIGLYLEHIGPGSGTHDGDIRPCCTRFRSGVHDRGLEPCSDIGSEEESVDGEGECEARYDDYRILLRVLFFVILE